MKSKTKIDEQMKRKTNPELVSTIMKAKKNEKWVKIAGIISGSARNRIGVNLDKIDKNTKEGDTVVIPGKVLSNGEISKKIRVVAFKFSSEAEKKLKNKKCEMVSIEKEIEINPKAEGIKIIK
ncbi:50S ribosomal protein L18e [Candidatus Pacearchaeota archaeon]|nr:50S ribosomal protein L18e [Candidatus Pacearchaeota archaeon]